MKQHFVNAGIPMELFQKAEEGEIDLIGLNVKEYLSNGVRSAATSEELNVLCCVALALCLLLRLKFYLKEMYLLENEKCQTYQPTQSVKVS